MLTIDKIRTAAWNIPRSRSYLYPSPLLSFSRKLNSQNRGG